MPVFQCNSNVYLRNGYDQYNLLSGQLLAVNEPKLLQYVEQHPNFNEVRDDELVRLAPPLHLVRQPEDPYRMRKEDMIAELRSYGISVDPYDFSQKLTMQLSLARKMLKRNFLTILNKQGYPVFIDSVNMPVPAITDQDNDLTEPDEIDPNSEFFEDEGEVVKEDPVVKEYKKPEPEKERPMPKDQVMAIEPSFDEMAVNEGMDYADFLAKAAGMEYKVPVEIEKAIEPVSFDPTVKKQKKFDFDGNPNSYKYLLETQDRRFMISTDKVDKEDLGEIKWSKMNIDVFENFLRYHKIECVYDETAKSKRWEVMGKAKEFYESSDQQEKLKYELLMLNLRYRELDKLEPNYSKFTNISIKRKLTELGKYGVNISYDNKTKLSKYGKKVYGLAKLGLQVPDTEEEIDEKLKLHKRSILLK